MTHRLPSLLVVVAALLGAGFQAPAPETAKPSPKPAPVLEGTVRGPDGKPVEKALVIARSGLADFAEGPLTTTTDAKGAFRLPLKDAGPYRVRVEAAGFAGATLERIRPGSPLSVTLSRGSNVQGSVRDGSTGQPVSGALVEARDNTGIALQWDPELGARSARTDAEGRYRIEGLASGLHGVTASVRGFAGARRADVRSGSSGVDFYLFPGGSVSGFVRDVEAAPVAGAVVRAEPETPTLNTMALRADVSRADGRFELAGLPAGAYRILARHREFAPAVSASLSVDKGSDANEDLVLERGGHLTGRLVDAEERPIPNGRVSVVELGGRTAPRSLVDLLRAEGGNDGRFRLGPLPPGDHALSVAAFGYSAKRVEASVARASAGDVGDVALEAGLRIRGVVRDRNGAPVPDARLTGFQLRSAVPGAQFPAEGRSAADGSFLIGGLAQGTYRLTVRAAGYGEVTRSVDAGAEKLELVLVPAGSVTGQAVDDAGQAVEVFRVEARAVTTGTAGPMGPGRSQDVSSPDGRFRLEDVAEGTHVLSLSAPERASATVSEVKVMSGAATDVGRVRLGAGGIVRGQVVDATGAGITGAAVATRGQSRDIFRSPFTTQALSDATGSFEIRGAPIGVVEVSATHPNYAGGRVTGVEVDPAKGPAEARIVLTQGGRIEGVALRRDGRAVQATISVIATGGAVGGMPPIGPTLVQTHDDGSYLVEHVPAGRVNVNLMATSGSSYVTAQNREAEVREGETTQVDFVTQDIFVSGRVTRSGAAAGGMRVSIRPEQGFTLSLSLGPPAAPTGPGRGSALTREDGSYEMIVGAPGKAFVNVQSADGKTALPVKTTLIPDADTHVLDLDFAGISVAGVVLDAETEAPLPQVDVFAVPKRMSPGEIAGPSGRAVSGTDGRFQFDVEPGAYRLSARLGEADYAAATLDLDVTESGAADVRLLLKRGAAILGKVIDSSGRGVGGIFLSAVAGDLSQMSSSGGTSSQPDGAFRIAGLRDEPHTVLARSDLGTFAVRTGVSPSEKALSLALRPGGRIRVEVAGPDDKPVAGTRVMVSRYRGAYINLFGATTNAQGVAELTAPAGPLEIHVGKEKLEGKGSVSVGEGGAASLSIKLAPMPEK